MLKIFHGWMISRIFEDDQHVGDMGEHGILISGENYFFWPLKPSVKSEFCEKLKTVVLGEHAKICFLIRSEDYSDLEEDEFWPTPFIHAECLQSENSSMFVPYLGTVYEMTPVSGKKHRMAVKKDGKSLGTISKRGLLRNKEFCDLPPDIPLPVRVFMCLAFSWRERHLLDGEWWQR